MLQTTFEDLGTSLAEVTFVVVDLETTGRSANDAQITEFGAVKVRGGAVLGEFQSLVRPTVAIPAFITVLTGISAPMVARAPGIETVLPAFLEFARGSVLVAHNANFDTSFLKAAASRTGHSWPAFPVVDTLQLARQLVSRDESPNHKLSSLAHLFGAVTAPDHRALHDARATVDVLHALIARVGNHGVHSIEDLLKYSAAVPAATRGKRSLADSMPSAPGVYVFKDAQAQPLYVGTSVDIRRRTHSYFTAAESRRRMREMVALAESITPIVCPTRLEAQVRELRLIAGHKPPYNRRSRHPERMVWVKLTIEPFPRMSIVKSLRPDGADYVGPFARRADAAEAIAAVHEVVPIRQCSQRLSATRRSAACVLEELGRCGAPCAGRQSVEQYAAVITHARAAMVGSPEAIVARLSERLRELTSAQRYEEAAAVRDRAVEFIRGAARAQRLAPLRASPQVMAAKRRETGGWDVICVRFGRLAGTCHVPAGADPMPAIAALDIAAEAVATPGSQSSTSAGALTLTGESELILDWLEGQGARLVDLVGRWTCPVGGAGAVRADVLTYGPVGIMRSGAQANAD